jgi:HlyD family secretion protein
VRKRHPAHAQLEDLVVVAPPGKGHDVWVRDDVGAARDAQRAASELHRMDTVLAGADLAALTHEVEQKRLTLKRIDAQLAGRPSVLERDDSPALAARIGAQHAANVSAYENSLPQERAALEKAEHDRAAAEEVKAKLAQTLPHYREQESAYAKLAEEGYAGRLMHADKQRERIEREQDLKSQEFAIRAAQATIERSQKTIAQIGADYRRLLQAERVETAAQLEKARQELAKQQHRTELLELKGPQAGIVKDLATHTPGTVVSPGTILMTLVPREERLRSEVWVANDDLGFVKPRQSVKVKLLAFPFQKYGMAEGTVAQVSADATEAPSPNTRPDTLTGRDRPMGPLSFRALVDLEAQQLESEGVKLPLNPGMQVVAEIHLGTRSVLEYVLSPVRKAWHEAARER